DSPSPPCNSSFPLLRALCRIGVRKSCKLHADFCPLTASTPQTLHLKRSVFPAQASRHYLRVRPIPPTSVNRSAPRVSRHNLARFVPHRFHPAASAPETAPLRARSPGSALQAAQRADVRFRWPPRKLPRRGHWPTAASLKRNEPRLRIQNRGRVANISSYASIRTPALPSLKSRNGGNRPRPGAPARF